MKVLEWVHLLWVAATLLDQRDRFIAGRIDATLRPGETGMLFLGAHHRVVRMLPATIAVQRLDDGRHLGPKKSRPG